MCNLLLKLYVLCNRCPLCRYIFLGTYQLFVYVVKQLQTAFISQYIFLAQWSYFYFSLANAFSFTIIC